MKVVSSAIKLTLCSHLINEFPGIFNEILCVIEKDLGQPEGPPIRD